MRICGRLREEYGWTFEYIDNLSMPQVEEIVDHWQEEPPVGVLLRSYFGVSSGEPAPEEIPAEPRVLTTAQLQRVLDAENGFADKAAKRNPFT